MQITKFSDYALRVLIHLAVSDATRLSTRQIAEQQRISFTHLAKVAQWLASEGYVSASRGRGGGMILARSPAEISIGELLRKSEAGSALVECLREDGGCCALTPACGLLPILSGAQEAFFAHLDSKTLEEVLCAQPAMRRLVMSMGGAE
jgi:Rrf2 family nitric oxide-sensitive transcriptional repressor